MQSSSVETESNTDPRRVIIREFGFNTSTHGIPGIARSQSLHNRIFWSISFVGFFGIMSFFVTQAILAYYSYPTQTLVRFANQWPQPFPAVTICNYSPFRYDQFIESYLNYTNTFNLTNTTNTDRTAFTQQQASYIYSYLQYKLNRNESVNQIFFSLSSMLIKCIYNGKNCSSDDFVTFQSSTYGLCYTFNAPTSAINNGSIHYNNENGQSGKLHLDLYIHSHQYVPFISDGNTINTSILYRS